jgi:hypothetical protein
LWLVFVQAEENRVPEKSRIKLRSGPVIVKSEYDL